MELSIHDKYFWPFIIMNNISYYKTEFELLFGHFVIL